MTDNGKVTMAVLGQRVGVLEKTVCDIDHKIDKLLTNHLPHIGSRMSSLETRINVLTAVNIGGIIIGLIISKIF